MTSKIQYIGFGEVPGTIWPKFRAYIHSNYLALLEKGPHTFATDDNKIIFEVYKGKYPFGLPVNIIGTIIK